MSTYLRSFVCIAALTASLLTGCGDSGDDDTGGTAEPTPAASTADPSTSPSEVAYDGLSIPQGLWARHLTPAQAHETAEQLGVAYGVIEEAVGPFADELILSYKIGDGVWAQYQAIDAGEPELGDWGTFTYDGDGNWSTVSNSTGCPGCVGVLEWSVDSDVLSLTYLPGHDEDPVSRFVTEGTWRLES